MEREAVGHLRRRERRDLQHVLEPVEERALLIVVDRLIRDRENVVSAKRRQRRVRLTRRLLKALELLSDLESRAQP